MHIYTNKDALFDKILFVPQVAVSVFCDWTMVALLQDDSAMEGLPSVPSRSASHQLGPGGHGPQIHH